MSLTRTHLNFSGVSVFELDDYPCGAGLVSPAAANVAVITDEPGLCRGCR